MFFPCHGELPADFGFDQRNGGKDIGIDFSGIVFGQQGNAHIVRHHVGNQIPLSGTADNIGRKTLIAAGRLNGFVEGKAGTEQNEGLVLQAFERQRIVSRPIFRHQDHQRIVAQRDAVEVFVNRREQLSGIEFVVAQGLLDGERALFQKRQFNVRPFLVEIKQRMTEQIAAKQSQTQTQRPAFDMAVIVNAGQQQIAFV